VKFKVENGGYPRYPPTSLWGILVRPFPEAPPPRVEAHQSGVQTAGCGTRSAFPLEGPNTKERSFCVALSIEGAAATSAASPTGLYQPTVACKFRRANCNPSCVDALLLKSLHAQR
jgi:hypothetical protein